MAGSVGTIVIEHETRRTEISKLSLFDASSWIFQYELCLFQSPGENFGSVRSASFCLQMFSASRLWAVQGRFGGDIKGRR